MYSLDRPNTMLVKKRNGEFEEVLFDKISNRLRTLCLGYNYKRIEVDENNKEHIQSKSVDSKLNVNYIKIAQQTIQNIFDKISTNQLDIISAQIAKSYILEHPDYEQLSSRILVSNLHKMTPDSFSQCMEQHILSRDYRDDNIIKFIRQHANELDAMIDHSRDYLFTYDAIKTLEKKAYLQTTKIGNDDESVVWDRPQFIYMRCAIHNRHDMQCDSTVKLRDIKEHYDLQSLHYFTHATPTLYNACKSNMMSCFLSGTDDSIEGIMDHLKKSAIISKNAGGIGSHMHSIRSYGQLIRSTKGKASGICKQIKMYEDAMMCFDQGGKRKGAMAIYLEPWHGDIVSFLQLKLNQGSDKERARDLFYGLWTPDLFIKCIKEDEDWYLFSEDTAPGLSDVYDGMEVCSICNYCPNLAYNKYIIQVNDRYNDHNEHDFILVDAFTTLYNRYKSQHKNVDVIKARKLLSMITESQKESGTPYSMFKDSVN
jgi:ribonucleoside-diphosphate reductase alpha chain